MGNRQSNEKTVDFVTKAMVGITVGTVLGPVSIPVGVATWGVSKMIAEQCDEEEVKEIFNFFGEIGGDVAIGGMVGSAVEVVAKGTGAVMGFNKVAGLGKNLTNCIDSAKHGIKIGGQIGNSIETIRSIGLSLK